MRTSPVIAAAALLLASCGSSSEVSDPAAGPAGDTVRVAFQSRVDGEIEPCG